MPLGYIITSMMAVDRNGGEDAAPHIVLDAEELGPW
jgi:hypothetical protein